MGSACAHPAPVLITEAQINIPNTGLHSTQQSSKQSTSTIKQARIFSRALPCKPDSAYAPAHWYGSGHSFKRPLTYPLQKKIQKACTWTCACAGSKAHAHTRVPHARAHRQCFRLEHVECCRGVHVSVSWTHAPCTVLSGIHHPYGLCGSF